MCKHINNLNIHNYSNDGQEQDEGKIISIISSTHAHPNPRTVMIESLDADIAYRTVRGARRPVDVTGIAVLNLQMMRLYVHSINFIHK